MKYILNAKVNHKHYKLIDDISIYDKKLNYKETLVRRLEITCYILGIFLLGKFQKRLRYTITDFRIC